MSDAAALERQCSLLKNPPQMLKQLLVTLEISGLKKTVERIRERISGSE